MFVSMKAGVPVTKHFFCPNYQCRLPNIMTKHTHTHNSITYQLFFLFFSTSVCHGSLTCCVHKSDACHIAAKVCLYLLLTDKEQPYPDLSL